MDCEGTQTGEDMRLVSASYGREDGTSATLTAPGHLTGQQTLRWLIDQLSGPYTGTDGVEYRQVPVAFHFTWDTAVITRDFTGDMMLVHKATARRRGLLCAVEDCPQDGSTGCGKLHRYDPDTIQDVISDGGEGDVIAWHRDSELAVAASTRRRLYAEHRPAGDRMEGRRILDIHDTGTAFVGGLLDVIDKWKPDLTPDQLAIIEWGKAHRTSGFLDGTPQMIAEYSEAECVAHARCVRLLLDSVKDAARITIRPSHLFGSGSVAARAFKFHRVAGREQTHTDRRILSGVELDDVARLTYFGGLIETPVLGLVAGAVDEVDLNSAYPAAMVDLPCMRVDHGDWVRIHGSRVDREPAPDDALGHVLASWVVDTPSTPPFVVRTPEGLVRQPLSGHRVWVTLAEYQAARRRFGDAVMAHDTVWWRPSCDCDSPLSWLEDLYDERQRIKLMMSSCYGSDPDHWQQLKCREEAIKLIINSCYGKLAQQRPQLGKYTNLHYAAHTTGTTRARVRQETWAREDAGGTVVYTHTDSVLSIGTTPGDGGSALGAWKLEKTSHDLLIAQPGLAVALAGGKTASRGCRRDQFTTAATDWAATTDLTQHPLDWPPMTIPRTMMISRRMAQARGRPELAGAFLPQPLTVSFDSGKRDVGAAVQMPGCPTAWIIPPILSAGRTATLEDLKQYQTRLAKRIKSGEFDVQVIEPTYDQIDNLQDSTDKPFTW